MFRTLKKIRDLLKSTFGNTFKKYWIDDPNLIPQSELPAIYIAPISTDIDIADTGRDKMVYTIEIGVVINAKQELRKYNEEIVGTQYLTEKMEGKDSNGALEKNTVLYVLRNNLTLDDNWYIENISSIDYSLRTRGTVPDQFVVKDATCRLTVVQILNRP